MKPEFYAQYSEHGMGVACFGSFVIGPSLFKFEITPLANQTVLAAAAKLVQIYR